MSTPLALLMLYLVPQLILFIIGFDSNVKFLRRYSFKRRLLIGATWPLWIWLPKNDPPRWYIKIVRRAIGGKELVKQIEEDQVIERLEKRGF